MARVSVLFWSISPALTREGLKCTLIINLSKFIRVSISQGCASTDLISSHPWHPTDPAPRARWVDVALCQARILNTRVHAHTHTGTHARAHTHAHAWAHTHTGTHVCTHTRTHRHTCIHMCTHEHTQTCTRRHTHRYERTGTHVCTHRHTRVRT